MTIHDVLLDPATFPEPNKFCPERWLEIKENEKRDLEQYLVAFSRGTRMCPGMEYVDHIRSALSNQLTVHRIAYTELYLTLAMIFRRFDLRLYETFRGRDVNIQRDCFIGQPDPESRGIRVQIVDRVNN
jgi:hypothetical protein